MSQARIPVMMLLCLALASCDRPQPPTNRVTAWRDTTTVELTRPTLVAYFIAPGPDTGDTERLADFQYSLDHVRDTLQRRGIQVIETYRDSIRLRWPSGEVHTYATAESDSAPLGYHFFPLGQTPVTQTGVLTDIDLLDAALRYLGSTPTSP